MKQIQTCKLKINCLVEIKFYKTPRHSLNGNGHFGYFGNWHMSTIQGVSVGLRYCQSYLQLKLKKP